VHALGVERELLGVLHLHRFGSFRDQRLRRQSSGGVSILKRSSFLPERTSSRPCLSNASPRGASSGGRKGILSFGVDEDQFIFQAQGGDEQAIAHCQASERVTVGMLGIGQAGSL